MKIINTKLSSKPCQTSEMELFARVVAGFRGELRISPTKMKLFAKIVENEKPFTIFPKTSVLDA